MKKGMENVFTGDQTAILCGHPSHKKVQPFAEQRQYFHLSVILRPRLFQGSKLIVDLPHCGQDSAVPVKVVLP